MARKVVFTDYALAMHVAQWVRTHPKEPLRTHPKGPPNTSYELNYPVDEDKTKYATLVPDKINKDECEF